MGEISRILFSFYRKNVLFLKLKRPCRTWANFLTQPHVARGAELKPGFQP